MYLRHSIRLQDGRVKHKNAKYLGPVKPLYKAKRKRKDNSHIFARRLTEAEIAVLKKYRNHNNNFTRDRAKTLLWSADKLSCIAIAEKLDCDVRKVRAAVKDFNNRGLKSLVRGKSKGAKPKFKAEQKAMILETASTDPLRLGMHFTTWSLPKLRRYLIDRGIVDSICLESVRTILRKENIRWKKSRRWQYSNDPGFVKKNLQRTH